MRIKAYCKFRGFAPGWQTKTLRVAKLTSIIIFAACLQVSAKGVAQTVTLKRTNVSLVSVFQEIQRQTGYNFLFTYEDVDRIGTVDVSLQNASLNEAIEACLHNKPLSYVIIEKTVVIKPKPAVAESRQPAQQSAEEPPPPTLHGRVVDSLGNPLVGASVTIKGTKNGTKTNIQGEFEIKSLPQGAVLVISYTGFTSKEVTPKPDANLWLVLQRSQDVLDAPVIQAYGTTSRRYNVGAISTIDAETISKQPVTNVLLAMQGQAPGLAINATSGVPGSKVEVQVRGQNTIQNSTSIQRPYDQPLFIIDGVPFAPQNNNLTQLNSLATSGSAVSGGISQNGGLSPFNGINPADIESISILKDADATSIYGTQGSNGVILITTKRGKAGKASFDLNVNTGFNADARTVKLLNTPQYLQLRRDAFAADGVTPNSTLYDPGYAPDLTIFDSTKYTDWQKVIFGKTSNNTDVHASLSGGSAQNTFLISTGYTRSDFNYPGNYSDQRFSLHTANHHSSADNRLGVDYGIDYSYDRNNSAGFGGAERILNPPNAPDLLDASGNLIWNYKGVDISGYQFYSSLKQVSLSNTDNLNTYLHLNYKVLPGLSVSANLGYSRNTTDANEQMPAAAQNPFDYVSVSSTFATSKYQTINIEPQIDYNNTFGKGLFSALVGASYKKNSSFSSSQTGTGYANDDFLGSIDGAATVQAFDASSIYKYSAGFARLKYVYTGKYIVSLTGRRDGSSNFGPGNQFGNFGSAGAGWIFSEEKAIKNSLSFLSFGKLSGSYGTSGSDGVGPYLFQSFWSPAQGYVSAVQGIQPNFPRNLYNPDYSWALKKSLNLAMDLGFFHDRLLLNATYYRDREGNQLVGYPLAAQAGFSQVNENLPATIQNAGWEFSFTSTNVKTKSFTWTSNFNITFNRNKLLAFPNLANSSYSNTYVIGKPTSVIIGYQYKGVNPQTGLFEYATRQGQDTISPTYGTAAQGGDQVPVADREVKFMGGFTNTFTYKHFSLYVFFQFSAQTAPNWISNIYAVNPPGQTTSNKPVAVLDYWKQPGDHTPLERMTSSPYGTSDAAQAGSNFVGSSGSFSNDTYLRLKTLAISYNFSEAALQKLHIHQLRIFANAQNVLTITNYKVGDPETFGDLTGFPLQRIVAFGLSFNF
jgi:TonB-dependent starch-binding outer membrane protein SusC